MVSKKSIVLFLITLFTSTSIWAQTEEIDGVTYDIVTITVDNITSYSDSNKPEIAKVKYNKLCPLIITSDDMGAGELVRNWAFFNGYPVYANNGYGHVSMGDGFLETPYNQAESGLQVQALKRDTHQPLTYSDGTGGVRRFTATSAIWPDQVNNTNYTLIKGSDAKTMIRMGWSFAQHDVDYSENDIKAGDYTAAQVEARFGPLSQSWAENATGIGLKVMVEPTGAHTYVDAGKLSNEICWNIFQNGVEGTYPEMTHTLISDWTSGTDWTTFGTNKPDKTTRRIFFQGNEEEFTNAINNADGAEFIIGGTHGIGDDILTFLKDLDKTTGTSAKKDQFWVAGADEVWEYYHLYNNAKIENINYANGTLTFQVKVPQYKKNQFRELTINIPGVTGGTTCTFSDNVITGSYQQNPGQYTINFGLEDKIYTYIEELTDYYRSHFHNTYVKDDAQYLINLLKPGTKKNEYQTNLDKEPNYSYTVKNNRGGIITSGIADEATAISYGFPKYVLDGTDLYETSANAECPYYVNTFTPSGKGQEITIDYDTKALENIVFYKEGEDLEGAGYNPTDKSKVNSDKNGEYLVYQNASGGAGGIITSSPITTLQPGKYRLVAVVGDSYNNNEHWATFTFKLGGKTFYTYQTIKTGIVEIVKDNIVVKEEQELTIEATENNVSRWLDYLYIQQTGTYDVTNPTINLSATATTIDVSDEVSSFTLTATTTPKGENATVTQTIIKDAVGNTLASQTGETCTYVFTPTELGNIVFTAEGTDSDGKTGLSDELTITVMSDFTLTARSNLGDDIGSVTFSGQTADKTYRFMYPRFLLKGTELYETEARGTTNNQLHYGEELNFTLANKNIERTIQYSATIPNVVYYTEGEDVENAYKWTNDKFDKNQGQSYALTLGSMGACGGFRSESQGSCNLTTLPAGQYKLTAVIGSTNSQTTYSFKAGENSIGSYTTTTSTDNLSTYTTEPFTLETPTAITAASSIGSSNSQNWLDLIYIQKLDDVPVTISSAGYATFSSPYALDFTNSNIKVYTATMNGDNVTMNKVEGSVPAATGLFLQGTVGTEVTKNIPLATSIPPTIENNALMPHLETGNVAAGNYVFSKDKNTGDLSFRKLANDTEVPGGRAYLSIPSEARNLTIEMDDATGIHLVPIEPATLTSPAYNIQGLPVSEHTKGIIIRNGRKYINTKKQ